MNFALTNIGMCFIFILSVFILFTFNGCAATKTVIFIYDVDTTEYDVDFLSRNIKHVSTMLFNDGMNFHFKILFPYYSYVEEISNSTILRNHSNVQVQSTFKSLLTNLQTSPSYSSIYVITNVTKPCSNQTSTDDVLEQIQIKRSQVNFLIGTEISYPDKDPLQEYQLITSVSNGFIIGPNIFKSDKFTDAIYMRLNSQTQRITLITAKTHLDEGSLQLNAVAHPYLKDTFEDFLFPTCDLMACEINAGKPPRSILANAVQTSDGSWHMDRERLFKIYPDVDVNNPDFFKTASLQGFNKRDFDFEYGFSALDVRSLNDTYRRPIKGISNKIYVSLTDKNFEHGIDGFVILYLNGTKFGEDTTVKQIQGTDLFVGSFYPPDKEYFYIYVTSYLDETSPVSRISSTAMSAADGFGDYHRNPLFEYQPSFRSQPTLESQPAASEYSFSKTSVFWVSFGVAVVLISMGLLSTSYSYTFYGFLKRKFRELFYERGTNTLQPLQLENDHQPDPAEQNVDRSAVDGKKSKSE